jgi:thiamine pyrophosphokinase
MRVQNGTVVVVAGGPAPFDRPASGSTRLEPGDATVIAADGGVDRARALGLEVHVAIGDFDSVSAEGLAATRAAGARIDEHPVAKDASDLELALDEAMALTPARIVVVGSSEGRLDHLLGSLLLLGHERYAATEIDAELGPALVHIVRDTRTFSGSRGELVSLFALGGDAEGVTTTGLVYPLAGERLVSGSSRGLSNVLAADVAGVSVRRGTIAVVRPGGTS